MLKEERHNLILEAVRQQSKVHTLELSTSLAVSEDTIRRDLKELADQGQLKKVHGGAVALSLNPFHYRDRKVYALDAKIALARKAQSLIRPQQVVLMDGGTTNVEVARHLPRDLEATIFTNSLPVAVELADHPVLKVIFLGGKLLKDAQVTVGESVLEVLRGIRADLCIMGTRSLHHQIGISEIDWEETQVKRAMVAASQETAALVIEEKLGTTQPYIITPPSGLTTLITPLEKRHPALLPYRELGIEIL